MGSGPLIIHREVMGFDKLASVADQDGTSISSIPAVSLVSVSPTITKTAQATMNNSRLQAGTLLASLSKVVAARWLGRGYGIPHLLSDKK